MSEDWISAALALERVREVAGPNAARLAICSRAHEGLIEAKALRLVWHDRSEDDCVVPKEFWWARGEAALKQNWAAGDFETWVDRTDHVLAYGVSFARSGIEAIVAAAGGPREEAIVAPAQNPLPSNTGGRPPAAWWDDLWIELCRQLYSGDLQPNRQVDIVTAMMKWASEHGHEPAESTIKERARKLWQALNREDGN